MAHSLADDLYSFLSTGNNEAKVSDSHTKDAKRSQSSRKEKRYDNTSNRGDRTRQAVNSYQVEERDGKVYVSGPKVQFPGRERGLSIENTRAHDSLSNSNVASNNSREGHFNQRQKPFLGRKREFFNPKESSLGTKDSEGNNVVAESDIIGNHKNNSRRGKWRARSNSQRRQPFGSHRAAGIQENYTDNLCTGFPNSITSSTQANNSSEKENKVSSQGSTSQSIRNIPKQRHNSASTEESLADSLYDTLAKPNVTSSYRDNPKQVTANEKEFSTPQHVRENLKLNSSEGNQESLAGDSMKTFEKRPHETTLADKNSEKADTLNSGEKGGKEQCKQSEIPSSSNPSTGAISKRPLEKHESIVGSKNKSYESVNPHMPIHPQHRNKEQFKLGLDFDHSENEKWNKVKKRNKQKKNVIQKNSEESLARSTENKNYQHGRNLNGNAILERRGNNVNIAGNSANTVNEEQNINETRTRQHLLGYRELEKLSEEDDPYEVIKILANRTYGFEKLLKQELRADLLILVIKLLSKLCNVEFVDLKIQLLSHACNFGFLDQLSRHIAVIPLEQNKKRRANIGLFFENLILFLGTVINLLPSKTTEEVFGKIFMMIDLTMKINEQQKFINEEVKKKFDLINSQYKICVEEENKKNSTKAESSVANLPPDDYRDISLFPTSDDVLSTEPAFIRPNIAKGAYESVEHYLDVQFRLLREDFVSPLREGISQYLDMDERKHVRKISNVRIYWKVVFLNPKTVKGRVGLTICFDPDKRLKKIVWEHSKRFMYGSLLVFTNNNFASVIFATVMDRNIEDLKKRIVTVQLSDIAINDELFMSEFVMAESNTYFEPYHRVMKALQDMKPSSFPLKDYIVSANVCDVAPKYLTREGGETLDVDGFPVSILEDNSWPSSEKLELDESQYNALRACLTREFAVVQGPPGTGKTFLGLKIARILLKNSPIWNASRTPLLVVCYTNHALDQFLEGLIPVTNKIVRVGGQSKSELLGAFNLREKRKTCDRNWGIFHLMRDIRSRMLDYLNSIKNLEIDLECIARHEGIISLSILKNFGISQQQLSCFEAATPELSDTYFVEWLEYGMYDDVPPNQEAANPNNVENDVLPEEEIENDDDDEAELQNWDDALDFDVDINEIVSHLKYALAIQKIQGEIEWIELQLRYLNEQRLEDPRLEQNMQQHEMIRDDLRLRLNYIKHQLTWEEYLDRRTLHQLLHHDNLWELQPTDRWHLYRYWVERLRMSLITELQRLEENFRMESRMYEDAQQINDFEIMKNSLVVGMTTTGAARLQSLLKALKARIVIVEEAAEVFESHIVVSLTNHCEHLILIGDHKQLRPSPAVFKLARDYKFDISLFERMITNEMHCEVLKVQHRMRPEIVQLIVPTIYPELANHSSVLGFERIKGMLKNLYFVTHNHPEEEVEDLTSRKNTHEGDFIMELCRYLVLQGYNPGRITILATYSGQMFYLRSIKKQYTSLSDVRITVIDNFQGEENDIILLSLVRSNKEARIGFLKTENRVCVALSRARMGLYIIGNMDNLVKGNEIWPKIRDTLKQQDAIGTHLTLRCQVHPSEFSRVCCAADFSNTPEGGCKRLCGALLPCGHNCKSICHIQNREHEMIRCFETCERIPRKCELGHRCLKICWQDCGDCVTPVKQTLPCGHVADVECGIDPSAYKCRTVIEVELPDCGHRVQKPCYRNVETFLCPHPCEDRLPCGHSCDSQCHTRNDPDHLEYKCTKPCTRTNAGCSENHACQKLCYEDCGSCSVRVKKKLLFCEHEGFMRCSQNPETYRCYERCQKKLRCGHDCKKTCSQACGDCPVKVMKHIEKCGHALEVKCCETPDQRNCMQTCNKILKCGHPCKNVCSKDCTEKCYVEVESQVRPACGHAVYIPCFMQNKNLTPYSEELLSLCQMPCGMLLGCEHRCVGTCGECRQGRIHKPCNEKCGRPQICGHSCKIPCAENCPPCNRKCLYKCKHSKCPKLCGQPCIQCKESCDWKCAHKKCTKLCYQQCNREPCNEPCNKLLTCKHPCIGFCGETCPPLCRICNEDEVTEIFFGNEDDPNARYVLLEDCGHIFEAEGLEQWMTQSDNEIKLKKCPKCNTAITKTQRYMNVTKKVYEDICRVKRRLFGELREIEGKRDELTAHLISLSDYEEIMKGSVEYTVVYDKLLCELKPVLRNRVNMLSSLDTGTLMIHIEVFSQLVENYHKVYKDLDRESKVEVLNYLDIIFRMMKEREKKISAQEVRDINMEIQRFYRLCQLFKLKSEPTCRANYCDAKINACFEKAYKIGFSINKFTKEQDNAMKFALETFGKEIKSAEKITESERKVIVQAMGFSKGHWFKCPNGHIYSIADCGGAMVVSKCNECGARIGGTNHQLLADNALASEMDGAVRPAWPM